MVQKDTESGPLDGLVEITVVKDDVGRFPTEFERYGLEVGSGRGLHDLTTDGTGTGKGDLADLGMFRDGSSDGRSVSIDDVDDTLYERMRRHVGSVSMMPALVWIYRWCQARQNRDSRRGTRLL